MPYQLINGARLFYQTFGKDAIDRIPILLIHGSTVTGNADWGEIAPLLASQRKLIVPDCRGHGRSNNPDHHYSFLEMASDAVNLAHALGYPKFHIIGHSNGGNVALVALMEYPASIQSAILQAANAYVSPDLLEIEPEKFNPERVARENPGWMRSMIALHGKTHGRDYWRDLLEITLREIISQPNYTAQNLAKVERPVMVIQGEKDSVNAASQHAQFIARHIPFSELWSPAGIGHNVHKEIPTTWLERVIEFLSRRGNDENEVLYRMKKSGYNDSRQAVFELKAERSGHEKIIVLSGKVLYKDQLKAAIQSLSSLNTSRSRSSINSEQVQILLTEETPSALVKRAVTDIRREPRNGAERVSQALMGESLQVLYKETDWSWVRLDRDGYMGWVQADALEIFSRQKIKDYQASFSVMVQQSLLPASHTHPAEKNTDEKRIINNQAGILPFGIRLPATGTKAGYTQVLLPDGRTWWVATGGLLSLSYCPKPDQVGIQIALDKIKGFIGVPYLWGGRTPYGYDCSGLAQMFLNSLGIFAPRDADQQFLAGKQVDGSPQPGDLLFFGEGNQSRTEERHAAITHVAISLGYDLVIHATGATWCTTINSLNPKHTLFRAWLRENLIGVRRLT